MREAKNIDDEHGQAYVFSYAQSINFDIWIWKIFGEKEMMFV